MFTGSGGFRERQLPSPRLISLFLVNKGFPFPDPVSHFRALQNSGASNISKKNDFRPEQEQLVAPHKFLPQVPINLFSRQQFIATLKAIAIFFV